VSRRPAPWLLTLAACALPGALRAQETDNSNPPPASAAASPAASPDRVVVTGSPLDRGAFDLAQPVSDLSGLDLREKRAVTLGDTLDGEPGIASSGFTAGASRPIIRGQQDNRVRVLNNGTEVFDVSNLSPDHAPSVAPLIVTSVEVVRGAATVLYGSGAIGGVVNVIDNRIPTALPANGRFGGELVGRMGSVDLERSGAFTLDLALTNHWVLHVDGTRFFTNDLKIPDHALSERSRRDLSPEARARDNGFGGDTVGYVPNTYVQTKDFGAGLSYVSDKGYVGASFNQFLSVYGVPVDPGAVVAPADQGTAAAPVPVRLDVTKRRGEFRASLVDPWPLFRVANFKLSYTDYKHLEIDGNEVGSTFKTNGLDSRLELVQQPLGALEGSVGAQVFYKHLSVLGADAFLQPSDTVQPAGFFFEEIKLLGGDGDLSAPPRPTGTDGKGAVAGGDASAFRPSLRVQLGGRVEYCHVSIDSTDPLRTSLQPGDRGQRAFLPLSAAAGVVYEFAKDTALALTLSYAERAPTAEELFARGPHDATFQYLIGDPNLGQEKQLGLDVSIRRRAGFVTGALSGFYNRFYDFIDFTPTDDVIDELQVFRYTAKNADFYGGEAFVDFHLLPASVSRPIAPPDSKSVKAVVARQDSEMIRNPRDLYLELKADYVHAEDRDTGESLPRITPLRFGAGLGYVSGNFSAKIEGVRVNHQYRIAPFETAMPGYTFLNATASYQLQLPPFGLTASSSPVTAEVFLRGSNLLDEQARNHQSFLKDVLPLPGRSLLGGLRLTF
ncbi:MAG: TonB-dependent receptor, partial [Verrucomicrobia bacterium]|nr:TonB-dependent receptor [Verrucomicrobiota bacterium]